MNFCERWDSSNYLAICNRSFRTEPHESELLAGKVLVGRILRVQLSKLRRVFGC